MFFSSNIKRLRIYRRKTQDAVAKYLGMQRSTLNSYENGLIKNPTIEALLKFSHYYYVTIDELIRVDLSKKTDYDLRCMQENFIKNTGTSNG